MNKMNVKPSKPLSAASLVGLIFMLMFGLGFTVLVWRVLAENEAPLAMTILFSLFMVGWIGTALFMLVYHILNLKRAKGLALIDIETESESLTGSAGSDPMQRLRSLEKLKNDGLITKEEYDLKRDEIIKEKW